MPVHIGGNVADMDAILASRPEAQAASHRGRLPGPSSRVAGPQGRARWGTPGCFSFQVSKNLCSGEGGAILTDDGDLANAATPSTTTAGPEGRQLPFRLSRAAGAPTCG